MESFWQKLNKPLFVLAPMADVTDPAYRRLIAEYAPPSVMWTEFVSADGLYHTREKAGMKDSENPLVRDLLFREGERPIVAQLFSSRPEMMSYAAKLCAELGFDGVDINMGCPDRSIEKQGCGAAMIKSPENAKAIIRAARESGLPVSVKTRIGYNQETLDEWIPELLSEAPEALTVHLRTRKEMSNVSAHWDLMPRIVALRDKHSPKTLILGNGDIKTLAEAKQKVEETGCDGVMLGRAVFGNPWLFTGRETSEILPEERIKALYTLAVYFNELTPAKHFHILKKHFKAFVQGWPGAAELRSELMQTGSLEELTAVLDQHKLVYSDA
ncbi:tRNA-dihydrouridine synthase [Patescibacteria group bacterium]|nr:tRNA-dihydrouridine synthase [Patescibacteria group bacterium]MBU2159121.1 tRNA-dihydrouridine synthase [Patescibacteria group bacterium]